MKNEVCRLSIGRLSVAIRGRARVGHALFPRKSFPRFYAHTISISIRRPLKAVLQSTCIIRSSYLVRPLWSEDA